MNINDIIRRDICNTEQEKQETNKSNRIDYYDIYECDLPWFNLAIWLIIGLAMLAVAFLGGMRYQSYRTVKANKDLESWNERADREETERAHAMSNYELLNAVKSKIAMDGEK